MRTFNEKSVIVKEAVEIISGEELQYKSLDQQIFSVGGITISIEDDHYKVNYKEIELELFKINDLLHFVLVHTTQQDGLYRLQDRCLNLSQMEPWDQKHISRLCHFEMWGTNKVTLYKNILFAGNRPTVISESFGVNIKLVKNLRNINRKAIITSIITELMTNKHEMLSAA